jgi:exodeoxyribonuclease VII large subunit
VNSGFVDRNRSPARESSGFSELGPVSARDCVTVSELNRVVAQALTRQFPMTWVSGEISNLTRASSGHCYFSLKDANAQVRCVMFRHRAQHLPFALRDGVKVECRAAVSLYEPRGDFQLNVEAMRQAGSGDLFQAFLALKAKLQAEGLFEEQRKKRLPTVVTRVGVVTSLQAAALRDVLATLRTRAPQIQVVIYPSPVQGVDAAASLAQAVRVANTRREVDLLLIVRGGGSLEDLWSFNDEYLARCIAQSALPTISGVGHETDFTICDFVADARAATPTAAAALASPDRQELLRELALLAKQLGRAVRGRYEQSAQSLDLAARLLRSPAQGLAHDSERLRRMHAQLLQAGRMRTRAARWAVEHAQASLQAERLRVSVLGGAERLARLAERLPGAAARYRGAHAERLDGLVHQLELVNPLAVLDRGYAIVRNPVNGSIVRQANQVHVGQLVRITLAQGELDAQVNSN